MLSSPACYSPVSNLLERAYVFAPCSSSEVARRMWNVKPGPIVVVVVSGKFEVRKEEGEAQRQGFGHQGKYSTRLLMHCVWVVKPLGQFKPLPEDKK